MLKKKMYAEIFGALKSLFATPPSLFAMPDTTSRFVSSFVKNIKGNKLGTMHFAQTKRPSEIEVMQMFGKKIIKKIKKTTKKLAKIVLFLSFFAIFFVLLQKLMLAFCFDFKKNVLIKKFMK